MKWTILPDLPAIWYRLLGYIQSAFLEIYHVVRGRCNLLPGESIRLYSSRVLNDQYHSLKSIYTVYDEAQWENYVSDHRALTMPVASGLTPVLPVLARLSVARIIFPQ